MLADLEDDEGAQLASLTTDLHNASMDDGVVGATVGSSSDRGASESGGDASSSPRGALATAAAAVLADVDIDVDLDSSRLSAAAPPTKRFRDGRNG